jgi:hypothetical protein
MIKKTERSGNVPHPNTLEVTNKSIVPKSIVFLDEVKCLLDTMQNGLGFETECYPNPKAVNSPASRKAKFEPIDKSGTLALPHVIEPYDTVADCLRALNSEGRADPPADQWFSLQTSMGPVR